MSVNWIDLPVAAVFAFMAYRAFRSGSMTDYGLCLLQCVALVLLFTPYRQYGLYALLVSAAMYLLSQVLTGARRVSYLLPVIGAMAVVASVAAMMGVRLARHPMEVYGDSAAQYIEHLARLRMLERLREG